MDIKAFGKHTLFLVKKYSPEILLATGTAATITSGILFSRAGTKAERMRKYETKAEQVKHYIPAALTMCAGIGCYFGTYTIMRRRFLAALAACAALEKAYKELATRNEYQNKVESLAASPNEEKEFEIIEDSPYAVVYSKETTNEWYEEIERIRFFLKQQEKFAQYKLDSDGYIFLNDVYKLLGLKKKTSVGQICGWKKGDNSDNFIEFRYDLKELADGSNSMIIDFNVDGVIWDKI